ncbi:unnamed protein product [Lupinus luteus]|uniref:Transcription factor HY5 n=1 Tax=Lupinus luteus TaxID=3873 RepID=A0AAV1W171_LUPLU
MSLPRTTEVKSNSITLQQLMKESGERTPSSSSSWNRSNNQTNSFHPLPPHKRSSKHDDSDEDIFTVPDVEGVDCEVRNRKSSKVNQRNESTVSNPHHLQTGKKRRGRNPVDKEYKRLKRLLRNRVSAQQARERKKVYVNDLESKGQELEDKNSKLEERISTLINENTMLRKVLMNTRPKVDESNEA